MTQRAMASNEKFENQLSQIIDSEEFKPESKILHFMKLSGLLDYFPKIKQKLDAKSIIKEELKTQNILLIPEGLTPIKDFYILPPYYHGMPIIPIASKANDCDKENNSSYTQTPYNKNTALVDITRGEINLSVVTGVYPPLTRYPSDKPYFVDIVNGLINLRLPAGYMSEVAGAIWQDVHLKTPLSNPQFLRVSVEIGLPVTPSPGDTTDPGIFMNVAEAGIYSDHISLLYPGESEFFGGLVGVTGEFKMSALNHEANVANTSSLPFLSRFQLPNTFAQSFYKQSLQIVIELFLPAGTQNLSIEMEALLTSYCCQDFSSSNSCPNSGPLSLVSFRNRSFANDNPIYEFPYYTQPWGPVFHDTSIKIKNLHLEFFDVPPPRLANEHNAD